MNAKKEGKQGFWASLFGRKPCGCACSEGIKMDTGATPAVVVDGVVKIKGHVPTEREIKEMLGLSV